MSKFRVELVKETVNEDGSSDWEIEMSNPEEAYQLMELFFEQHEGEDFSGYHSFVPKGVDIDSEEGKMAIFLGYVIMDHVKDVLDTEKTDDRFSSAGS